MAKPPRRVRREPPKVWHNPDVVGLRRPSEPEQPQQEAAPQDRRVRGPARIVVGSKEPRDEKEVLLERLLERLSVAEGRAAISKIVAEVEEHGLVLPQDDQMTALQLLEHSDESRVQSALANLARILDKEPAKRATVLDSRLRRLEEFADEQATRQAAAELRKRVKALPGVT